MVLGSIPRPGATRTVITGNPEGRHEGSHGTLHKKVENILESDKNQFAQECYNHFYFVLVYIVN